MTITSVEIKASNKFDPQWVDVLVTCEDSSGSALNHYLRVPTTAEKSFLFGSKKSLREFNDLTKFFLGLGINLDYVTAIHQLADIFSDTSGLIGQTITLRLGYFSNYTKFVGKENDVSIYILSSKDGKDLTGKTFSGYEAAEAYAAEEAIKLQPFPKVLDVIPGTTLKLAPTASNDLPF